jgi:acetyl esterase/lipase
MSLSKQLIKEVLKEVRGFPPHIYKVVQNRVKKKIAVYEKYTFGPHAKQYLCWFEPLKVTRDEIIIFYHGGAWTFGTPELFNDRAAIFIQNGYRVVMPSHRKLPFYNSTQIREDLNLTLKKIGEIIKEKGIHYKRMIFGGMSSGGNLAALMFLDSKLLNNTGFKKNDFLAAFLCAAPVNLEGMTDSFVLSRFAGAKKSKMFKNASPINHIPKDFSKPLLLVHGTNDGLVKYQSTADFVNEVEKRSSQPVNFHSINNGSHLDAVSWAYEDNTVRKMILNWLCKI